MYVKGQVNVAQAASRLGISKYQVYRRIMRGDLAAEKVRGTGIHWMIKEEDLAAYIAAGGAQVLSAPREIPRDDDALRVPEVAMLTGYSAETIREMCHDGMIPHTKGRGHKGHFRIPRSALHDLMKK